MEILPGVFWLKIPIPDVELGQLNAYLIKAGQESLLIDTGWNLEESYQALCQQLIQAAAPLSNLKYLVITHTHPDHFGLVHRIAGETNAELILHKLELDFINANSNHQGSRFEILNGWMAANGLPEDERLALQRFPLADMGLQTVKMRQRIIEGGEHLTIGDFDLELIWTPGHTPGHICIYEKNQGLLFSGDHVLEEITPNISVNPFSPRKPLVDYINSLKCVENLPVQLVLPSHGVPFKDLHKRVHELENHHKERLATILQAIEIEPKTPYQIAQRIPWSKPGTHWEDLAPFHKYLAVMETLAHLQLLEDEGSITRGGDNGLVQFSLN